MSMPRRQILCSTLCLIAGAVMPTCAHADGLEALAQFIQQTRSGRAQFTQVVTSPARQGQATRSKTSSGSFEFQRPGKFRFDYRKPFVQTLVADGQTLWLHDADLNQVTARNQAQVLGSTPVALLTSAADLESLKADFTFKAEPDSEGLQWVRATSKKPDGQIQSVLVGLRAVEKGVALAVLDVQDSLGQRSALSFSGFDLNPVLPTASFAFKVPAGADVMRP